MISAMEEMTHRRGARIEHADGRFFRADYSPARAAELCQHLLWIVLGCQFMPQINQHVKTRQVSILEFQVLFMKELRLTLNLAGLFEELNKNRHLRSQDLRLDRLHDVVNGAERVSSTQVPDAGAVGGEKNDRYIARLLSAANEFSRFQSVDAWHVDIQQHDGNFVIEQNPQ